MRLIGHLKNEASARTFADYLDSMEIRNLVESDPEGWAVWIHSEDQIEAGQKALAAYQQNPAQPQYQKAGEAAAAVERRREREEQEFAKRFHTGDRIWAKSGRTPLTLTLIGACVLLAVLDGLDPAAWPNIHWLWFSEFGTGIMTELRDGQVWRLLTPIFIHIGATHLIFNMIWLRDLGGMIERRRGTLKLALMVAVLGVGSNLGQYFWEGPLFGGMSGVVYGLFGYIWIRSLCDPSSGLALSSSAVWIMLVWFFVCVFNVFPQFIPPVANAAHAAGLILGMLWGAAPMAGRLFRS